MTGHKLAGVFLVILSDDVDANGAASLHTVGVQESMDEVMLGSRRGLCS